MPQVIINGTKLVKLSTDSGYHTNTDTLYMVDGKEGVRCCRSCSTCPLYETALTQRLTCSQVFRLLFTKHSTIYRRCT